MHTRKNTLIVDEDKKIRFISPTRNGRFHDLKLFKKEAIAPSFPKGYSIWADKGYRGIHSLLPDQVEALMSLRKKGERDLTQSEILNNKAISSLRMPVEHSIGEMKRYGCMQTPIRNKNWAIEDKVPLLCAALWNFHLSRR